MRRLVDWDGIGPEDGSVFFGPPPATLAERQALRREGRDWPRHARTMIGLERLAQFGRAVETVVREDIPGDVLEAGVWRGGASLLARTVLRALGDADRTVWLADSFAGLPPPNPERFPADAGDEHWREGFLRVSQAEVAAGFAEHGLLDDQVRFLPGWFQETLPAAPVERLAVLRLDGDMYESNWVALQALYDKVSPGGFVIIDDYGAVAGGRQAVDDFRAARGIHAPLERIDWTGCFWRVPLPAAANRDLWQGYRSVEAERLMARAEAVAATDTAAAEALALQALAEDPDTLPAHLLLARLRMPGPDYRHHLAALHSALRPRRYVEIGVGPGDSLALAAADCPTVAVDPAPRVAQPIRCRHLTLVRQTSDAFFASGEAAALIGPEGFDIAFIDGSHLAEQVLADFLNLESFAAPGAVIALHDVLPLDAATASRERQTTFWSGDAWRALPALARLRPWLRISRLATAPTGLALVSGMRPAPRPDEAALAAALAAAEWPASADVLPSLPESIAALLHGGLGAEFDARLGSLAAWQAWAGRHPEIFAPVRLAAQCRQSLAEGIWLPGEAAVVPAHLAGPHLRESLLAAGLNARQRALLALLATELPAGTRPRLWGDGLDALKPVLAACGQPVGPDEPCEVVVSAERLHQAPHPEALLAAYAAQLVAPGGLLLATFPFAANQAADTFLGQLGQDLVPEPDAAGNYWLPGWNMLRACHRAGFSSATMALVGSVRHGIFDEECAGLFALVARR
jgi:O-methyltransferase